MTFGQSSLGLRQKLREKDKILTKSTNSPTFFKIKYFQSYTRYQTTAENFSRFIYTP